jgi:hypothetical protein
MTRGRHQYCMGSHTMVSVPKCYKFYHQGKVLYVKAKTKQQIADHFKLTYAATSSSTVLIKPSEAAGQEIIDISM